jgi:hypothetical protein
VFLNLVGLILNVAPNNTYLFLGDAMEDGSLDITEIRTKGTSTAKLVDFGVKEDSVIYVKQFHNNYDLKNVRNFIVQHISGMTGANGQILYSQVNEHYFDVNAINNNGDDCKLIY